jgi:ABC-2 type transport system ATP-binding protein
MPSGNYGEPTDMTAAVTASNISKSFNRQRVVADVSFDIQQAEIFGLIGPNGAGKTTTIRMLMDIIKPEAGEIKLFGEPVGTAVKRRIGYLPEERGLYRKLSVEQTLDYLARLKGYPSAKLPARVDYLLGLVDLGTHRKKKIEELSRGMSQLVQFLVTISHDPDLIILDEPFANLDPVNTELIKQIVRDLQREGKTIIFSTHRMNEVEELCDRVLMVHRGRSVLNGYLLEIQDEYRDNAVIVQSDAPLDDLRGVSARREHPDGVELMLEDGVFPQQVLEQLMARGANISRFEVATPSLHEIFLKVAGQS